MITPCGIYLFKWGDSNIIIDFSWIICDQLPIWCNSIKLCCCYQTCCYFNLKPLSIIFLLKRKLDSDRDGDKKNIYEHLHCKENKVLAGILRWRL